MRTLLRKHSNAQHERPRGTSTGIAVVGSWRVCIWPAGHGTGAVPSGDGRLVQAHQAWNRTAMRLSAHFNATADAHMDGEKKPPIAAVRFEL